MNILITGGAGYIGSKLVIALKESGHQVEIFDRPKDIRNIKELEEAIEGKDVVYHLAALAELTYTDAHPEETFDVNIIGTNNVAKVCADKKVLLQLVSTCCIYGDPMEYPCTEKTQINPTDTYAMSKASGEYLVKMWGLSRGLKYNILRFGTVYGPSIDKKMRSDMCIQKFVEAAVNKEDITITGTGKQARNFIHIDDLVKGIVALNESNITGEIFNFAGNERISVMDIAEMAVELGVERMIFIDDRKDDFFDQDISLEKSEMLLGWKPEIAFKKGFNDFYLWLKEQQ